MTSTLIVRDVLLLVHGEPQGPRDPEEHLRERTAALGSLSKEQVAEALELLGPAVGEEADAEVLEAALLMGLAYPGPASDHGLSAAVQGRQLAEMHERDGDSGAACAVLRVVCEHQPGNLALERSLAALMRRQGMASELVDRYLARAQEFLDAGCPQEAIPWLREVLQLDRSRKDVARMIRDLRFDEAASKRNAKRRVRAMLVSLLITAGVVAAVLREYRVRQDYAALPSGEDGQLASLRDRLSSLEGFIDTTPVWHGALGALKERSELRVKIDRLNTEEMARREMQAQSRRRSDMMADSARTRARQAVERGDFEAALTEFRAALELASADWNHRARTERDVESLEAFLRSEDSEEVGE